MDWRHRAECRDMDPEMFFPNPVLGLVGLQVDAAKAVCAVCPVIDECLAFAMSNGMQAGVWGGLSEEERRARRVDARRDGRQPRVA